MEQNGDIIDMSRPVTVLERDTVYQGAVFSVEDGGDIVVRRQVMRHAPCVVMLVHDTANDRYLMEREYRAGSDLFAYGLPAGLMDAGEDVMAAALRELREETGVVPDGADAVHVDHAGAFYSSEGMSDELAHIMVLHLDRWHTVPRHLDADEHVWSAWVTWDELIQAGVTSSNSMIAIQHEAAVCHAQRRNRRTRFPFVRIPNRLDGIPRRAGRHVRYWNYADQTRFDVSARRPL